MPDPIKFMPDSSGLGDFFYLWKHFEDTGDAYKDRTVTAVSLLFGFAVVILSYIVLNDLALDRSGGRWVCAANPGQAAVLGASGLLICLYSGYLVNAYRIAAQQNCSRADQLQYMMPGLKVLMKDAPAVKRDTSEKPNFVRRQWTIFDQVTKGFKMFLFIVAFTSVMFVAVLILAWQGRC